MSTINRLAPYAYLAKRDGNNALYDLYLLVPVDDSGDTDLSGISVKSLTDNRLGLDYSTNNTGTNVPYRFKHIEINKGKDVEDILIQGDNNPDRMVVLTFDGLNTQAETSNNDFHTCAPYVSTRIEKVSNSEAFVHMSCIVFLESGQVIQSESMVFGPNQCEPNIVLGNGTTATDVSKLLINQDIKARLTFEEVYTIEVDVTDTSNLNKPPRKNKVKVLWT